MKVYSLSILFLIVVIAGCQAPQETLLQEKLQQAETYMATGNYEEAIWILKQAEEHIDQPSQTAAQIYSSLSLLNHEGGDYEKAIHYQDKAQDINRQLPRKASAIPFKNIIHSYISSAKLLEVNGKTEQAESIYLQAIQTMPQNAYFAYQNLANLYDRTCRPAWADSLYQEALQTDNPSIRQAISQTLYHRYLQRKDTAQAMLHLHRYAVLTDSLAYTSGKKNFLSIQARYDQEAVARKKAEMQRNYLMIFIIASALTGAIAYGWRKKVTKERECARHALQTEQKANQEKEIKINQLKAIQGLRKESISLTREQIAAFDYYVRFKESPTCYSAKEDRKKLACWLDMAHNDFATRLKTSFPDLTPREEDICYLYRLGYSAIDIKDILGMAQANSVTKAISRTCSKLHLDNRQKSLSEFILNF